jgi:tetratricopeptide (TPR) repeat protein
VQKILINHLYAHCFETPVEDIKYLKQLAGLDDMSGNAFLGLTHFAIGQYDKAVPELEKSLNMVMKLYSKPIWPIDYFWLVSAYINTGQFRKGKALLKKSEKYFPDSPMLTWQKAVIKLIEGDSTSANRYIDKYKSICKDNSMNELDLSINLADLYTEAGIVDKAEAYYRKAIALDPQMAGLLRLLANFLIDKERNINEGMELVEQYLKLKPENYLILDTKGWGFYKQGKYKEALDLLQKSWDLRRQKALYDHQAYLHLESAKKAVASLK